MDKDGTEKTPVVLHRAILGSLDRFMAYLIEETKGKFPTWLAPVQVKVLPVSEKTLDYAQDVTEKLVEAGVRVALYEAVGSLKVITRFVKYARVKEEDSGPSCSLAEALEKQDLFINSTLAQLGCNILWKMFRNGMIEHHGVYLNLATMKVNPISI